MVEYEYKIINQNMNCLVDIMNILNVKCDRTTRSCEWCDFNVACALSLSPPISAKDDIIHEEEEEEEVNVMKIIDV